MLGATVVTAIAGPLVEPVVHVAVLVGVVVMEGPLLRFLFVVLIFARLLVILFLTEAAVFIRASGSAARADKAGTTGAAQSTGRMSAASTRRLRASSAVSVMNVSERKGIVVRRSYQVRDPHARARRTP